MAAAYPLIWAVLPSVSTHLGPGPSPPPLNGVPPFPLPCYWTVLSSVLCLSISTLNQGSAEELFAYHLYPGLPPVSESPLDLRGKVVVTVPLLSPTRQTPAWRKPVLPTSFPHVGITNVGSTCFPGQPQDVLALCILTAGPGCHTSTGGPKAQHTAQKRVLYFLIIRISPCNYHFLWDLGKGLDLQRWL